MPDAAPNSDLLHSLGRLVRGLSALFWGLPLSLIVCFGAGVAGWFHSLRSLAFVPPMAVTGLLLFGLWQLGAFQRQERPWRRALDRARLLALANFFLSPFLSWWHRMPEQPFFGIMVCALVLSGLLFLFSLNNVLRRLGEMLPDEALRHEIRQYTALNRNLLVVLFTLGVTFFGLQHYLMPMPDLPDQIVLLGYALRTLWLAMLLVCLLLLLPLAMTMALIWKTKEVILDSVFGGRA